jgi:hypothetical protein
MITATNIQIGTLIHGTLRSEDLIPAFTRELAYLSDAQHPLLDEINQFDWASEDIRLNIGDSQQEIASELVNDLMDALNEYAPAHAYFGTLEGDGSDFGFWPDTDSFEGCDKHVMETPSPLRGDTEWFDLDCGVIVQVNDHGNVSVSQPYCDIENHKPGGTNLCEVGVCLVAGHEIWSVV